MNKEYKEDDLLASGSSSEGALLATLGSSSGKAIELLSALLSGKTLVRDFDHHEHKQTLQCEYFQGKPYFDVNGWGSGFGNANDRVIGIIETNGAGWRVELPNPETSVATDDATGNPKLATKFFTEEEVESFLKKQRELCMSEFFRLNPHISSWANGVAESILNAPSPLK